MPGLERPICLVTGATGFVGRHVYSHLRELHQCYSLARSGGDVQCDLVDSVPDLPHVDCVIHAAGLAHVFGKQSGDWTLFRKQNVIGTQNLLRALENHKLPSSIILVSTVAVYGLDSGSNIQESARTNPNSPFGESKLSAEQLVQDWCRVNQVSSLILRLPLVAGSHCPGNLGRMAKSIRKGTFRKIGLGNARRSMVLVSDVAAAMPRWIGKSGVYNLTDGYHPSFAELEQVICRHFKCKPKHGLPKTLVRWACRIGDYSGNWQPLNSKLFMKMTSELTFNDDRARSELAWNSNRVLEAKIDW